MWLLTKELKDIEVKEFIRSLEFSKCKSALDNCSLFNAIGTFDTGKLLRTNDWSFASALDLCVCLTWFKSWVMQWVALVLMQEQFEKHKTMQC